VSTNWLLLLGVATVAGWLSVWLARWTARRLGFVDRPDGHRKLQTQNVALCGGLGVLLGPVLSLMLVPLWDATFLGNVREQLPKAVSLLVAAFVIALVGLVDDLVSLRARHKLVGQLLAALILVGPGGYVIDSIALFGNTIDLGHAAFPLTLFWFLAAINAINLLDGMDGMLGTIGIVILGAIGAMALSLNHVLVGYISLAMVGALLGFLYFNLPPATIYLGDCGSMLIGLVIAALTISASLKGPAVAILAPAAMLILPILDTTAAITRRKLTGRGLAIADRGHLHHELQRRGMNRWSVLAIAGVLGMIGSAGGLLGVIHQNDLYAIAATAVVVLILLTTGLFGISELRLITHRAYAVFETARKKKSNYEVAVHVQGHVNWRSLWQKMTEQASLLGMQSLCLDVNAPAWHESFHGRWDRADSRIALSTQHCWKLELPVPCRDKIIGKMILIGMPDALPISESLAIFWDLLREVEVLLPELKRPAAGEPALLAERAQRAKELTLSASA